MSEVAISIPSVDSLWFLRPVEYPNLVSGSALCWVVDDLVYSEYGYPGTGCGATSVPDWYGSAAEFARQLAPLCVWPCTFTIKSLVVKEWGGGARRANLEIVCPENPWLAPAERTLITKGSPESWAQERLVTTQRLIGGIIEALAFFNRTGQAVLPRWISDDHSGRDRWVKGKKHKRFYPRIQDREVV